MEIDRDFVIDQLEQVCANSKMTRNDMVIVCPFHADSSPSCSVHVSGHKLPVGTYHCWSCGAKGPWSRLAEQLGLEAGDNYCPENPFRAKRRALQEKLRQEEENTKQAITDFMPVGSIPWDHGEFRGIPEDFLIKLKARRWYDDACSCFRIVFPVVNNNGINIGSVARRLDKEKIIPWKNSPGDWARKALFPLQLMPSTMDTVVLVEGPFDAIRLNYFGIPTLSLLGAQNWSEKKMSVLDSKRVKRIIICMDGDKAGREAEKKIFESTENRFKRKRFRIPIDEENPIDPGNMDLEKIKTLKEFGKF